MINWKKLNYFFYGLLVSGVLLLITGYSFSWDFLNYFLATLIVLYPIVRFFMSPLSIGSKIVISIFCLLVIGIGLYGYAFARAFGEHEENIRSWKAPGYAMILKSKIGWAGPPYKEYDLYRRPLLGIIEKNISSEYHDPDKEDPCMIRFSLLSGKKLVFNKCSRETIHYR